MSSFEKFAELAIDKRPNRPQLGAAVSVAVLLFVDQLIIAACLYFGFYYNQGVGGRWQLYFDLVGMSALSISLIKLFSNDYLSGRSAFRSFLFDCVYVLGGAVLNAVFIFISNPKWSLLLQATLLGWLMVFLTLPAIQYVVRMVLSKFKFWNEYVAVVYLQRDGEEYFRYDSSSWLGRHVAINLFVTDTVEPGKAKAEDNVFVDDKVAEIFIKWQDILPVLNNIGCKSVALAYHEKDSVNLSGLIDDILLNFNMLMLLPSYGQKDSNEDQGELRTIRVIKSNVNSLSYRIIKRCLDLVGATILMLLLSPIMLCLAFIVGRDGGKPIFGHERVGRDGKKFKCYKFRTMVLNSSEVLQNLLESNPDARAEWDREFKLRNDPRVTKIGNFLRKSSFDELPQLWNIIKGEMSLVGPRPIVVKELDKYGEDVKFYLAMRPGLTGLWQVSGRNNLTYAQRVAMDVDYAKAWSIFKDVIILFKTVYVVLRRDGAY
ncbi:exopolysaccharide biosynthesis polyprenyl glycosylphosphotransferase [Chromobacterium sp. IIBBL 290-4]|uniref:exopolysaccharide biosynthesis polyprenyl glycosylphosphotransferase n=1 Tax=Chromobacterium sp. IIBBL 290-4 TaxID=2953890 RepID=UPI0020B73994|nr:exopolysaccharide biosynthesis polyprenyl glycosylphosphotransferase [Chromobacterium sp. IIBBL 290-4]UTH72832.1 exopolysaccharide biosynthesis polyprenyl glycosylphosphotransferase [Chromobacterium sp. IIBBL 290-4]